LVVTSQRHALAEGLLLQLLELELLVVPREALPLPPIAPWSQGARRLLQRGCHFLCGQTGSARGGRELGFRGTEARSSLAVHVNASTSRTPDQEGASALMLHGGSFHLGVRVNAGEHFKEFFLVLVMAARESPRLAEGEEFSASNLRAGTGRFSRGS